MNSRADCMPATATVPPYGLCLTRTAEKAQKNLDKPLRLKLKAALEGLAYAPRLQGEQLKEPLSAVLAHHVKYQGVEWRIAYKIDEEAKRVVIVMIGPHENFYKALKRLLDSFFG
jgi:mRNA-degrading endonuclease RelE of RelBE toxin-antitoxin system